MATLQDVAFRMKELILAGEELDAAALNFALAVSYSLTDPDPSFALNSNLKRLSAAQDAWRAVVEKIRSE